MSFAETAYYSTLLCTNLCSTKLLQKLFSNIQINTLHHFYILADKIQISQTTWMVLSMQGGFVMEERGMIEVKVI